MIIDTIVTDMDDTLFKEEGKLSDFALEVMRECGRRGIRVIPSSGRAQPSMEPYMRQLNTQLPYIACNGAQIVNADHTMMEELVLPAALAQEVCAFWEGEGSYVQAYSGDLFYYSKEGIPSQRYKQSSGMAGMEVGDLTRFLTFDTPKLLAVGEPEDIARLYRLSRERYGDELVFTISKPYFCEVTPPGATKGDALARLAGRLGIVPERTMVFGDSLNDLSMFEFTPHSVAMENGRDEVKRAARFLCGPNTQDGMARFVQERVLSQLP
ncbi:MAG: Cof-type HAD-IIB family hydrolase [Candidatus Limiplasma sp.]|nr:Cof-type HAD-IIB family hydrolase [Candidatus Limiplasma sp.]